MASTIRFVHCGGFRFDSPSWEGPASWVAMRNQDLWQTFEAVCTLCRNEKADVLLLSGDLFEQEYVRRETVQRVAASLGNLKETSVFIAPGQRDPLVSTSAYRLTVWPENVHIFTGGIRPVDIPERNVTIYGEGWTTYRQERAFLDDFTSTGYAETIRLMLLHAVVAPAQNPEGFIPITQAQIAASGLTYLALGHQNKSSGIQQAGKTFWADCGSVEPRSFQEPVPHGVILGTVEGQSARFEFRELGQRRYIEKALSLPEGAMEDTLKGATKDALKGATKAVVAHLMDETTEAQRQKDLFRIRLTASGPVAVEAAQNLQTLLQEKFSYVEVIVEEEDLLQSSAAGEETTVTADHSNANRFPTLLQVFQTKIQKRIDKPDGEEEQRHWELVQKIGLAALAQGREDIPEPNGAQGWQAGQELWAVNIKDGQRLPIPEYMTVAEYFGGEGPGALPQGCFMNWPEGKEDEFYRRLRNLRQTGDENLSLSKAQNSLAGAQKKQEEQKESIALIKAEYDGLRQEWDEANRRKEEERSLLIEIKNQQAQATNLTEKIAGITKIQERLAVLRQNPDYRELRKMQGELARWEEQRRDSETGLNAFTAEVNVDWTLIEKLREECLEWAGCQEKVSRLAAEAESRQQQIRERQNELQRSGYQGLAEGEEQRLNRAEEEKNAAQMELDKLAQQSEKIRGRIQTINEELVRLPQNDVFAAVTATGERRLEQEVRRLAQWQRFKLGGTLDRVMREKLGWTAVGDRLATRLEHELQKYQATDHEEFKRQLNHYREQQQQTERMQAELERLRQGVKQEEELRQIVLSRSQLLLWAYEAVQTDNLLAWRQGWEEYQRQKDELDEWRNELPQVQELQQQAEAKLAQSAENLREKLKNWAAPATDIEEALAVVMKLAGLWRVKEEAERETAAARRRYDTLRDQRNIEQLARVLEPLADLEREACLAEADRQTKLTAWRQEQAETHTRQTKAEQQLQLNRNIPVKRDLEKKLETVKQRLKVYEDLHQALEDTQALLEDCRQEWQTRYGYTLEAETRRVFSRYAPMIAPEIMNQNIAETKRNYFASRIAIAQLTLGETLAETLEEGTGSLLFFYVEEMNETPVFWEEIIAYLQLLARERPVIFSTPDERLRKLAVKKVD